MERVFATPELLALLPPPVSSDSFRTANPTRRGSRRNQPGVPHAHMLRFRGDARFSCRGARAPCPAVTSPGAAMIHR